MSTKEDPSNKQLRIQLGICKRMVKEVASYEKEVVVNEAKVQKMRDDGKDSYDIRKQEEVLQESYMMIPDSKSRLEKVVSELIDIVNDVSANPQINAELLAEANELITANDNNTGGFTTGDAGDDEEPL